MSIDTLGRITGYVKAEEICDFIRDNWDPNVKNLVRYQKHSSDLKEFTNYKVNEHAKTNKFWYSEYGFITFVYKNESRMLFYNYSNINFLENKEYYEERNLLDMVEAETTYISLGCCGYAKEIILTLLKEFGGGWLDENDCDEIPYVYIKGNIPKKRIPSCPCCGGKGVLYTKYDFYDAPVFSHVYCKECGLKTKEYAAAKEAIMAWSRRA